VAETSFDVLIIGSGPGGYVAAIRAAQLASRPPSSSAILSAASASTGAASRPSAAALGRDLSLHAACQGLRLKADNVSFDAQAIVARSRGVSKRLNDGVGFLMKKNKVSIIWARPSSTRPAR